MSGKQELLIRGGVLPPLIAGQKEFNNKLRIRHRMDEIGDREHRDELRERLMNIGDSIKTTKLIRLQKTGILLPRQGTFGDIENLGRKLILINFGLAGEEYLFPNEVLTDTSDEPLGARNEKSPAILIDDHFFDTDFITTKL